MDVIPYWGCIVPDTLNDHSAFKTLRSITRTLHNIPEDFNLHVVSYCVTVCMFTDTSESSEGKA
jgi:hypothetical protein